MISRRAALGGTAVAAVVGAAAAAHLLHVDDDILRALGAEPKPLPDEGDTALLRSAADDQEEIIAGLAALADADGELDLDDLRALADEQLAALTGPPDEGASTGSTAEPPEDADAFADRVDEIGAQRQQDVMEADSRALVSVLASLSAGHAQLAQTLRSRS